eukprot:scaffold93361_cov63-Phaeocystis_antarctica.AAC.2
MHRSRQSVCLSRDLDRRRGALEAGVGEGAGAVVRDVLDLGLGLGSGLGLGLGESLEAGTREEETRHAPAAQ